MKRYISLLNIVLVFSLLVAGCGKPAPTEAPAEEPTSTPVPPTPTLLPSLIEQVYGGSLFGIEVPETWDLVDLSEPGRVEAAFEGDDAAVHVSIVEVGENWSEETMAAAADAFVQSFAASETYPNASSFAIESTSMYEAMVNTCFTDEDLESITCSSTRLTYSGKLLSAISILVTPVFADAIAPELNTIFSSYWINEDAWFSWEFPMDDVEYLEESRFNGRFMIASEYPTATCRCGLMAPAKTSRDQCVTWCVMYLNPWLSSLIPAGFAAASLAISGKTLVLMAADGTTKIALGPALLAKASGVVAAVAAGWIIGTSAGCHLRCWWGSSSYNWARP